MSLRPVKVIALGLALLMALTACDDIPDDNTPTPGPPELISPSSGALLSGYTATGRGNPDVPANPYRDDSFHTLGGFTIYTAAGGASHVGVDVSAHQRQVDWAQVKGAGVEFVMLRTGFRGYGEAGAIVQDAYFEENIQGALEAGLDVGVYFFSQAVSEEEAEEEARQVLAWIEPYEITYPVVFDWESIPHDKARTDYVMPHTVNNCVLAFCAVVEEAGYTPMVYFNRNQAYQVMNLSLLSGCEFWLASYAATPSFDYTFHMWQYTNKGTVPGIDGDVDLNICMVEYPKPAQAPEEPEGET